MVAFFAVLTVVIAGLLWPVRLSFKLNLDTANTSIILGVRIFYALIPLNVLIRIEYPSISATSVHIISFGKIRKLDLIKRGAKAIVKRGVLKNIIKIFSHVAKIENISISARIGIADDAALSVMIVGALCAALKLSIKALQWKKEPSICITPQFNQNMLLVNLEGILILFTAKIMYQAIKHNFKKKGAFLNVTPNRKHYEDVHGAD